MSESTAFAMPLRRSPFEGHKPGEQATASGQIGVRLHADTVPGLLLISTWPSGSIALRNVMARTLGASAPARCGQVAQVQAGMLLCTGPEEYLLLTSPGPSRLQELRGHIPGHLGSVTDLGHARCRIHMEGAQCRDTLSKLFALDLREAAWPVGELRQTGHHHVPCTALRLGVDSFDLLVFSTYAFDQLGTLIDAALEYGVGLRLGAEPPA